MELLINIKIRQGIYHRGHMLHYNFQKFTCRAIVASRTILFVEGGIGWNNW